MSYLGLVQAVFVSFFLYHDFLSSPTDSKNVIRLILNKKSLHITSMSSIIVVQIPASEWRMDKQRHFSRVHLSYQQ